MKKPKDMFTHVWRGLVGRKPPKENTTIRELDDAVVELREDLDDAIENGGGGIGGEVNLSAYMRKDVYDTDNDGVVDDAENARNATITIDGGQI